MLVIGKVQDQVFKDAQDYFNTSWSNLKDRQMSVDYAKYADESKVKYWIYRFYGMVRVIDFLITIFGVFQKWLVPRVIHNLPKI